MSNKQQVKVQVTGVLTHGHGAYVYLQYGQYPCDSNLTVTVLIKCLEQISPLPKVLYVQMDNCCGQNKNKYVLSFLAHLVQKGKFRKVCVQFLKYSNFNGMYFICMADQTHFTQGLISPTALLMSLKLDGETDTT